MQFQAEADIFHQSVEQNAFNSAAEIILSDHSQQRAKKDPFTAVVNKASSMHDGVES